MHKVLVLLSTYNGEKYLLEQLNSLISQVGVEVSILVRDDGSTDATRSILEEWQDKGLLTWYEGENLKPAMSFLDLVKHAPKSDYYAYCDQDDVWFEDKLITAVTALDKFDSQQLNLYTSTYDVVDDQLGFIQQRDMHFETPLTLPSTILERCPSGCTMVFNYALKNMVARKKPDFIRMHDYWTLMITEAFGGNIVADAESRILYRQHANNSVGHGKGIKTEIKRLVNSAVNGDNERQRQAKSLYDCYHDILPEKSIKQLEKVINYRDSFKNRLDLAFDKEFRSTSLKPNMLFVGSVLLGLF
ncbi:glycosyltransferase [Jeotgalibaca sp. A122]|uniref:glycosyltransferase n=1 Tax=Jeotgalibaca sp. A122 TaxID=3457322 RepID=UPI003FD3E18D